LPLVTNLYVGGVVGEMGVKENARLWLARRRMHRRSGAVNRTMDYD